MEQRDGLGLHRFRILQSNPLDATASSTDAGGEVMDQLSQYTTNRIIELENLLLVDVEEAV